MGCAMGPASSVNWEVRSIITSSMRFTGRLFMSAVNSCSKQKGHGGMRKAYNAVLLFKGGCSCQR